MEKKNYYISSSSYFYRLITHSDCLKEIDLEHNLIGDLGGRELLEAIMDRKEGEICKSSKCNFSSDLICSLF